MHDTVRRRGLRPLLLVLLIVRGLVRCCGHEIVSFARPDYVIMIHLLYSLVSQPEVEKTLRQGSIGLMRTVCDKLLKHKVCFCASFTFYHSLY